MNPNKLYHSLYYNPISPACFSNESELKRAVKQKDNSAPVKNVKRWMSEQLTHSLHKPARRRFKRNKYYVTAIGELAQADLADLSMFAQQNDGYKYLLTFIDVFSKKAFVKTLKTKSGPEVKDALLNIFREFRPQSLQTDRGKEFINEQVKQLCKENGINLFFTFNQDVKCAVVERFNRTLKGRMYKYFTAYGTRRYIDVLEKIVQGYNNTQHGTIKMTPNEVSNQNSDEVFKNTYKADSPMEYTLGKRNEEKTKFKVGDKVRVKYTLTPMDKSYYPNWSDQVFTIIMVSNGDTRDMYEISDELNMKQPRRFYSYELQKVVGDPVFRIEKVIKQGRTKSLVKWLNHPDSFNSWVDNKQIKNGTRKFISKNGS